MFVDVVGSTEFRARVGEEVAERFRLELDEIVVGSVGERGGMIVKHLGDGMMATFGAAANALDAAVLVQQRLDHANRLREGDRIVMRVGIASGDVTIDGDDCFGLPVVEAQRLEASAVPGTIRCSDLVARLVGGGRGFTFRALGPVELKGLPAPVDVVEVVWAPLPEPTRPLPPLLVSPSAMPFAGRDNALAELKQMWKSVSAGGFGMVLVSGEPGVGKTRLCQELAAPIAGGGGVVLAGGCDEDVNVPFQPFVAALRWQLRDDPELTVLGHLPGELVRLAPELIALHADLPPMLSSDPDLERARLFQALESWLCATAAGAPTLLVIDDVHWADVSSLQLLRRLASASVARLLVVGTFRDTDVDSTQQLASILADLRRTATVSRISLDGLAAADVLDLMTRAGGQLLDGSGVSLAEAVHRETSGNPFFVGEIVRLLAETGDFEPEVVGRLEGVREVVGQRLRRLELSVQDLLRAGSVIGVEFDVELAATVAHQDVDAAVDSLEQAQHAHLLREVGVGRYRFEHALVRDALHADMSLTRRARQHRLVAEALERRHANDLDIAVVELAVHWRDAGEQDKAVEYAIAAGEQATRRHAPEIAAEWYRAALATIGDNTPVQPHRLRALGGLADAQFHAGDPAWRSTAHTAARLAIDTRDPAAAYRALTLRSRVDYASTGAADPERANLLRDALDRLDALSAGQRAELLSALATELIYTHDFDERRRRVEQREALWPQLDLLERAHCLADPGANPGSGLTRSDTLPRAATIRAALDAEHDPLRRANLCVALWISSVILGQRDTDRDAIRRLAEAIGDLPLDWLRGVLHLADQIMEPLIDGDLRRVAAGVATIEHAFGETHHDQGHGYAHFCNVMLLQVRGDHHELAALTAPQAAADPPVEWWRAIHAHACLVVDVDQARTALNGLDVGLIPDDAVWGLVISCWAEVAATIGSQQQCKALAGALQHQRGMNLMTGGWFGGPADRLLAKLHLRLGQPDLAAQEFAAAFALSRAFESPPWTARTCIDWAHALADAGDTSHAEQQLEQALTALGDLDLPDHRRRIDNLVGRLQR